MIEAPASWRESLKERIDELKHALKLGLKYSKYLKKLNKEERAICRTLLKHFEQIKNEPEKTKELYLQIVLNSASKEEFNKLISDRFQENWFRRAIACHNFGVENDFVSAGIDWQAWHSYSGTENEEILIYDAANIDALWAELGDLLSSLKGCFVGTELYSSIKKDVMGIRKRKSEIQRGLVPFTESCSEIFFPVYKKSLDYIIKKKKKIKVGSEHDLLFVKIGNILKAFAGQATRCKYTVKLWRRNPMDIFQGNWSDCCIAIGNGCHPAPNYRLPGVNYKKYPAGITEFLIDKGIQVAEVVDEEDYVIGSSWLFLSLNKELHPVLIVDSCDLNRNFVFSNPQKKAIRSCLCRFLKKYARAIGARQVLFAKNGQYMPDGQKREIIHDIKLDDLPVVPVKLIEKLGGYLMNEPYFLESRFGTEAFELAVR